MIFNNKKLLIFDLDGTLADTIGAIADGVNMALTHFSYPTKTEDEVRRAIGNGARMLVKRLMPETEAEDDEKVSKVLACYNKMYEKTYLHTTEMYDGIEETVHKLIESGLTVAVFSNKQDAYVKGLVDQFFKNGEVTVARGQTDIPIKPDPAGVKLILDQLGVSPSECIFVGDSGVDLKTAQNSEMDFIGVAWGFCGRKELLELGADTVVDKPQEILKLINII